MDETSRAAVVQVPFDNYERGELLIDEEVLEAIRQSGKSHFLTFVNAPYSEREE